MTSQNPLFERTQILIGDEGVERLEKSHVFLAGIGGVGSFAAEALARMGVGEITLVDHDIVSASNINRQLIALNSTIGQLKVDVMVKRINDINPACKVNIITEFLSPASLPDVITSKYDVIVDAIDSMASKAQLMATAWHKNIPIFASMGAGGKLNPSLIRTDDIMDTSMCRLAKQLRGHLRRKGVGRGIQTVYSIEQSLPALPPEAVAHGRPRAVNGTMSYMPSIFGLTLAGMATNHIIGNARRV